MREGVVLIHGIWMTGHEMVLLQRRLKRCGFLVHRFVYPSVRRTVAENAFRLNQFLKTLPESRIHLVAHSLGGLVVRHLYHDFPDQRPGRVVTLGTPHRGSRTAAALCRFRPLRRLLGKASQGLLGDVPLWEGGRELGVIAGNVPVGVGRLFTRFDTSNDGTVAVSETRLAGAADHLVLPVSHTGLVFSPRVAGQVCRFLRTGEFDHTGGRIGS